MTPVAGVALLSETFPEIRAERGSVANPKSTLAAPRGANATDRHNIAPFESTPIVVDGVLYFSTPSNRVIALDAETGAEIWKYDPKSNAREIRGVSYWPGETQIPPRILFGTGDGRLIGLDAKTGTPAAGFGDNGVVNLKAGITDKFPNAAYAITSPPTIYRHIVIVGPSTQEGPSLGPSGDTRAYDGCGAPAPPY